MWQRICHLHDTLVCNISFALSHQVCSAKSFHPDDEEDAVVRRRSAARPRLGRHASRRPAAGAGGRRPPEAAHNIIRRNRACIVVPRYAAVFASAQLIRSANRMSKLNDTFTSLSRR